MYNEHLVSIITPAYNSEKYISEAIESVLKQTYTQWEMIIVNDVSTDNTELIVKKYLEQDRRISLINLKENSGAAIARNTALKSVRGRFIAFLDSDDKWKNNKLEKQINFMIENNYHFTFTRFEYIIDDNNNQQKIFQVPKFLNYTEALKNTSIGCLTVMIDRNETGDFEMPLVRRGQDNLTWLMLMKKGIIAYGLSENLAEYRRVKGSLSNNKLKALKRQWYNYRKIIKLPFLKCCYYYSCYVYNNLKKYYFDKE